MSLFSDLPSDLKKRLIIALVAIFVMITAGTVGFKYFEQISWWESFYFTTATVTTVGYGDIVPKSHAGQLFTSIFILFGVGTVLYALSVLAQSFIQAEIVSALGISRKNREMENLTGHYIVCGGGRVGRRIMNSLRKEKIPYVLIEVDKNKIDRLKPAEKKYFIKGDATLEDNLIQAGVKRAAGLASCLSDDAKNVYVVLTARDLNKDLHIVSRAVEEQAESKLIRAGANRVVSPIIIGSQSMTRALIKPAIADFMDSIIAENLDLVFEEIPVNSRSNYVNHEIRDTNIGRQLNVLIVGIRRSDGEMIFNPAADAKIIANDLLIVIGKAESVQKLAEASK